VAIPTTGKGRKIGKIELGRKSVTLQTEYKASVGETRGGGDMCQRKGKKVSIAKRSLLKLALAG
jgi:hypothetical protein